MRLWSIWNLLSSFLYFCGFLIGWVLFALLLYLFLPPVWAIMFAFCVAAGVVAGVYGNVKNAREKRTDAELHEMASGRHRTKRL